MQELSVAEHSVATMAFVKQTACIREWLDGNNSQPTKARRHEPMRLERVQPGPLLRAARQRRKGPSFCYVLLIMY